MKRYKTAKNFIKYARLKKGYTYHDLQELTKRQGFHPYEFRPGLERDIMLFRKLQSEIEAKILTSFTYCSNNNKYVFVKQQITEEEKKHLLMHENIHIFVGDLKTPGVISVTNEKRTAETHFIVDLILNYKKIIISLITALTICVTATSFAVTHFFIDRILYASNKAESSETDFVQETLPPHSQTVYITPAGHKYHKASCPMLEGTKIPIEKSTAAKTYAPCKICNPQ